MLSLRHFETGIEFDQSFDISVNEQKTLSFIDQLVMINALPFKNNTIFFNDDYWDFSSFTGLNIAKKDLKFNFNRINGEFKIELKKFVLVKILENKTKISSIKRAFQDLSLYFNFLYGSHVYSIKDVTTDLLKIYLQTRENISALALRFSKQVLLNFYAYYAANYENLLTSSMETLLDLGSIQAFMAIKEQNKTPDIPGVYFDKLIQALITVLDDPEESDAIKASACIILITSQTGLRISEVLSLEINSLKTISIYGGKEANYLTYKTWKREKGENRYSIERTYVNQLTKKAYNLLSELHKNRRSKIKVPYLYTGNKLLRDADYYPVDANAFLRFQKELYIHIHKYIPTVDLDSNSMINLHTTKLDQSYKRTLAKANLTGRTLTYPETRQYRVHVCTELYNKGVPLKYIQKFMGHLSSEMQGYYVRPKDQTQENVEFSQKTLSDLITGKLTLLGSSSNDLTSKINDFISDNNFKIEKDLNTIVDTLMGKIPVRQKLGGVCIKASMLRECSIDAKTNEFYCAYGVCPNVFHFFYNIDISYRKANELSQSIKINEANGFKKQVQKEKNMLRTVISKQFESELAELKKELTKRSVEEIFMEYPDIQEVVENLKNIELEVEEWRILINA